MTEKKRDIKEVIIDDIDYIDNIDIIAIIDIIGNKDRGIKCLFVPFLCSMGKSGKYGLRTKGTNKANIITG